MHHSLLDKAFLLKKSPFFASLDLDLLLILAEKAELVAYRSNEIIFAKGSETDKMYLIAEGEIAINTTIVLKAGECFGDEALFNQNTHAYSALSQKRSQLLVLLRSHILSLLEQSPAFAHTLLTLYTENLPCRHKK